MLSALLATQPQHLTSLISPQLLELLDGLLKVLVINVKLQQSLCRICSAAIDTALPFRPSSTQ